MPNPHAGEVTLEINGCPHILRLSLGALAALEARLQVGSLIALVARFESGGFSASDVLALLAAGLQGAGHSLTEAELAQAQIGGGPLRAAQVAAQLLALSFGSADPASAADAVSTVADQK
nr:gene transfer agent family protein [Phaeobacter sp.]